MGDRYHYCPSQLPNDEISLELALQPKPHSAVAGAQVLSAAGDSQPPATRLKLCFLWTVKLQCCDPQTSASS